jgi:type VI protein secretion system component VasF
MIQDNWDKSLIDYLKEIPDERDANGRRHPLWLILLIMILGIMSGYWGYRGLVEKGLNRVTIKQLKPCLCKSI